MNLKLWPISTKKGAVKLHVGLDHDDLLPAFMAITDGKSHGITDPNLFNYQKAVL